MQTVTEQPHPVGDVAPKAEQLSGGPYAAAMAAPAYQRVPGWYRRLIVLVLLAAVGVPALNGALWLQETRSAEPAREASPRGAGAPAPPGQVQSGSATAPPSAAVLDLLQRRSAAVLAGDRAAWLATVDSGDAALTRRQGELFDRLATVRPSAWSYTPEPADVQLPPDRQAALGAPAVLAHVRLTYRLAPEAAAVDRDQHLTLVQRGGRWLVGGDQDGPQQRDLWDLGPVTVSRGARSVVVCAQGASVPAARTATEADAAARRVDAVWGTAWPRSVVVMVPARLADMATLLDRTTSDGLDQLAAVTTGELRRTTGTGGSTGSTTGSATGSAAGSAAGSPGGRTTGDRVVVNPVAFPGLTPVGRGVVLTHEFTHVATRAGDAVAPPVWVDEGFADYVAYLDSSLGLRDVAADLLDDPKAVANLRDLPSDADFDPTSGRVGPAYAAAWLAMRFVATQGGTPMVVDFYRVASGLEPLRSWPAEAPARPSLQPRTPLEHACAEVVGYVQPSFVRRWLVYVRSRG